MLKNKEKILSEAASCGISEVIVPLIDKLETLDLENDADLKRTFHLLDSGISSWNEEKRVVYDMILNDLPKDALSKVFDIGENIERTPEEIKKLDDEWKVDDFDSWKELSPFGTGSVAKHLNALSAGCLPRKNKEDE
jgi:hypothetical protein